MLSLLDLKVLLGRIPLVSPEILVPNHPFRTLTHYNISNPFQFCLYLRRFQMQSGWKPLPRRYSVICLVHPSPKEIAQRRAQVAELESAKVT